MNVRIYVGAAAAYASIVDASRLLDVRLAPGRSAAQSLEESAEELRAKARSLLDRADIMSRAAQFLGR